MTAAIIEIQPKKPQFDPLSKQVQSSLLENGGTPGDAEVRTERLYRIEGDVTSEQIDAAARQLLVDPVVETAHVLSVGTGKTKNGEKKKGFMVDVWPKSGVTDPVGETVEKGLRDLGLKGECRAASGTRYIFPKMQDEKLIRNFATQFLANELIHDIHIRKNQ